MADFIETNNTKTAVRELTVPFADITTFNTVVQSVLDDNPFGCVDYVQAGVAHDGVEKNKESYTTRGGREHLTIVKAKYIQPMEASLLDEQVDIEELKRDCWDQEMLVATVELLGAALRNGSGDPVGASYGDSDEF